MAVGTRVTDVARVGGCVSRQGPSGRVRRQRCSQGPLYWSLPPPSALSSILSTPSTLRSAPSPLSSLPPLLSALPPLRFTPEAASRLLSRPRGTRRLPPEHPLLSSLPPLLLTPLCSLCSLRPLCSPPSPLSPPLCAPCPPLSRRRIAACLPATARAAHRTQRALLGPTPGRDVGSRGVERQGPVRVRATAWARLPRAPTCLAPSARGRCLPAWLTLAGRGVGWSPHVGWSPDGCWCSGGRRWRVPRGRASGEEAQGGILCLRRARDPTYAPPPCRVSSPASQPPSVYEEREIPRNLLPHLAVSRPQPPTLRALAVWVVWAGG